MIGIPRDAASTGNSVPNSIEPVGVVRSPRLNGLDDWGDVESRIELDPEVYEPTATVGLEGYSHVEVIFSFHLAPKTCRGAQHPRGNPDWPEVGILAQRAPNRPNHLGVSVCELLAVDGLTLTVRGLDALDATPVLDVKPYLLDFAPRGEVREPQWSRDLMRDYF
ncbi:tRNA (N6-threonylcarbamoyladenosine(37)-N6)-methyltransferase TrmO [Streptomyces agglomeratus]|uniref:tRNA (N6-threonylcarbamoyladenosine(37)-N6)-methyltransferase TrmO n=1 Tax=Streptomyces agglomeratus TaxID=285458 RepID=A0A1E5P4T2_9ACTN|nr:tRNA (N6-threonylcarbamoyladenosine(37)-N6)-methyltransferase TrmO [Streptomyces agglomeratus]OEJ53978.1 tRNA (N6-threonylcarbamoyladenosine(37)-N6)-methyltransferase TrmO [Streptomyces agglomeratus]OEJ61353.1 tRNA (N6-threonylcarbamoyladenosine(37)-N6)-methyltransferase TrmO [Streptomyces agglomeratus]